MGGHNLARPVLSAERPSSAQCHLRRGARSRPQSARGCAEVKHKAVAPEVAPCAEVMSGTEQMAKQRQREKLCEWFLQKEFERDMRRRTEDELRREAFRNERRKQ